MNLKLVVGVVGGYLLISHLRKRGAITVNKDDPAGKVVDDMANTGDKITAVGAQVKDAISERIGSEPEGTHPADTDAALATIF